MKYSQIVHDITIALNEKKQDYYDVILP